MTLDDQPRPGRGIPWFAATILTSSFLVFQVQPLIGKYILPWFGGTPGVWSTCLLFFQLVLFGGYAYAHALNRCFGYRTQCLIHCSGLLVAIIMLPIAPAESWKPSGTEDPTLRILGLLLASVGLPYFLLAANGPLLQTWFRRANPSRSPYVLYSLSNIGSLLGLISYPFLFERWWTVDTQAQFWSWSFVLFAVLSVVSIAIASRFPDPKETFDAGTDGAGKDAAPWFWFALSACGSILLLSATNQVCIDVASIPFLWVVPLTLYLLTFIFVFADPPWYPRRLLAGLLVVSLVGLCWVLQLGADARIDAQIAAFFGTMFVGCWICHGELVRLKPNPAYLTRFYMWISAGGATGGVLVAIVAPLLFSQFIELHLGVLACAALAGWRYWRDPPIQWPGIWSRAVSGFYVVGMVLLAGYLWLSVRGKPVDLVAVHRNFFGVLRVWDEAGIRFLIHGQIEHGSQIISEELRKTPIGYFSPESGAGRAMSGDGGPRSIGVIGLGVGTLATYGRPGDRIRFYEINPVVKDIASTYFHYISDSEAADRIEFSLGDGRLSLEREDPQHFDVLVVDAFNSDSVPTHLLTVEAFEIYLRHLAEDGILCVQVSNRHFDLAPVVRGAARNWNLWMTQVRARSDKERYVNPSRYVLLARSAEPLRALGLESLEDPTDSDPSRRVQVWTDQYSNLFGALHPLW